MICTQENKFSQIVSEGYYTPLLESHKTYLHNSYAKDNSLILIQGFLNLFHQVTFSPLTSVDISKNTHSKMLK